MTLDSCFSQNYAQARERFLAAARRREAHLESHKLDRTGVLGEELSTDIALVRAPDAKGLLIISSAMHGVEGFCGSACQLALLDDEDLLKRARDAGVALLLIHAINPYGFSWCSRTNEENVDLNRNAQPFPGPLPENPGYAELHPLLLPAVWPPNAENRKAIAAYVEQRGPIAFRDAVSRGQYTHPGGLFFGGDRATWSRRTLEHALRSHGAGFADIGWIDVHTGLGPAGHGEKIFAGRRDPEEIARARRWWGLDVAVPFAGTSASADITGHLTSNAQAVCPDARHTLMALEFGTVPFETMIDALRGEAWLRAHPDASTDLADLIRLQVRNAFYFDQDAWKGMVLGQSRLAILQAIAGLKPD